MADGTTNSTSSSSTMIKSQQNKFLSEMVNDEDEYGELAARFVKDLKETGGTSCGGDSSSEEEGSVGQIAIQSEEDQKIADALKLHKKHVERRFRRSLIWGSIAWFIACGRALSRMGVKGAHLGALRKVARLGAGIKLASLPEVVHFKTRIHGVKVRIYRPANQQAGSKLPVCLFVHGGGWVMCTTRTYHAFTLELSRDLNAVVVSIDYRLAPEFPYPIPLDDCLAVTRAILKADEEPEIVGPHLASWIDTTRVAMAGDSAGANLSCAVALDLARSGDLANQVCGLCMICPSVQPITTEFESHQKFGRHSTARSGWFLSLYAGIHDPSPSLVREIKYGRHVPEDFLKKFVDKYIANWKTDGNKEPVPIPENAAVPGIPEAVTKLSLSPRAWPLLASDEELSKLPVTFIQTCSDDCLRDEGLVFSERLRQVGAVDVRYFYLPRAQHCEPIFHNTIPTKAARLGYEQIIAFLTDILGTSSDKKAN